MLGNFTAKELQEAKDKLESVKTYKLAMVAHKHKKDPLRLKDVFDHLKSEALELEDAFKDKSRDNYIDNVLEELADVSNTIDIITMVVIAAERPDP